MQTSCHGYKGEKGALVEKRSRKCGTDLVLGQWGLRLTVWSLALLLTFIPPHGGATGRGSHTRHGADLCNLVCLCHWRAG